MSNIDPRHLPAASEPSRWRSRLARAKPHWSAAIAALASARIDRAALDALGADERAAPAWRDEAHLRATLRHVRTKTLAALMDRDLARLADLAEVMAAMTALAELTIGAALAYLSFDLAALHGVPHGERSGSPQDLLVIGMGKLGGGELNVSSDIDLIFVYGEDGETRAEAAAQGAAVAAFVATRPLSNQEFFSRLGRRLIAALSEITGDGFVFRVDMRLRPDGDSGPLAVSLDMLENYLVAKARDWERFAWIKARIVSTPVWEMQSASDPSASAVALATVVTPFVYRRYLDFGAIDALRKLHEQIRAEALRREAARTGRSAARARSDSAGPRLDVKLGRGGIREIEFIAQHFQLIRGGREAALRTQPTLATLAKLAELKLLERDTAMRLVDAYTFLRDVEHRLQYLDDAQTHVLPGSSAEAADDRARIAAMCVPLLHERSESTAVVPPPLQGEGRGGDGSQGDGWSGDGFRPSAPPTAFETLVAELESVRGFVALCFDDLFGGAARALGDPRDAVFVTTPVSPGETLWARFGDAASNDAPPESDREFTRDALVALGYAPPDPAIARLAALARSARVRTLAAATRERLDTLVAHVLEAAANERDPNATLARWFDLIEAIAGRSAYLALLDEFPRARSAVTRVLAASPWAAQYLTRHPILLDELLDARERAEERTQRADASANWRMHWIEVAQRLSAELEHATGDTERQMDVLREMHHAETFRLLIDDLEDRLTVEALSDQLSALADLILAAALAACWATLNDGDTANACAAPRFAIVAYGKLGGKELGYASDLDLIFLYDDRADHATAIAPQRYARLAQRLNVWLTARTTAGALFDIDLRLRPDGAAGLIVSGFEAWRRYQRREDNVGAWTWEHQALTRARFVAGDAMLGAAFEAEREEILATRAPAEADRAVLRRDIVAMRAKMHEGHPNPSGLFDLKHDCGGMVDIEFCVQYLVLAYGGRHRAMLADAGNIALLSRAAELGLIEANDAHHTANAYRAYRRCQHALRLADPSAKAARVAAERFRDERLAVETLWTTLFGAV